VYHLKHVTSLDFQGFFKALIEEADARTEGKPSFLRTNETLVSQ
jgi:hypothetical protein